MGAIYKELLDCLSAVQFDVFRNRLTVPRFRKLKIALEIWLRSKLRRGDL
jgi:phytoene/squalene synthetase